MINLWISPDLDKGNKTSVHTNHVDGEGGHSLAFIPFLQTVPCLNLILAGHNEQNNVMNSIIAAATGVKMDWQVDNIMQKAKRHKSTCTYLVLWPGFRHKWESMTRNKTCGAVESKAKFTLSGGSILGQIQTGSLTQKLHLTHTQTRNELRRQSGSWPLIKWVVSKLWFIYI